MTGDAGGVLDRAAVFEVGGDTRRTERVATNRRWQSGMSSATFHHRQYFGSMQPPACGLSPTIERAKEWRFRFAADAVKIGIDIGFGVVVSGNFVALTSLFMKAKPPAFALLKIVLGVHPDDGAHPGEAVDHHANECSIAQSRNRRRVDRVEQLPRLVRRQNGRLPFLDDVLRAADRRCGIARNGLPKHEPIEEHPNGGEVLLHTRFGKGRADFLYIGGDVDRLNVQQRQTMMLAPAQELVRRTGVREARVRITDVRGEKLDEPSGRLAPRVRDHRRDTARERDSELTSTEFNGLRCGFRRRRERMVDRSSERWSR